MTIRKPLSWVAFYAGAVIAPYGVMLLTIVAFGSVNNGHVPLAVSGVSALVASTPLLILPFSSRAAGMLLAFVLLMFGAGMLWLAFGSRHSTDPDYWFNAAAIGFTVVLLVRLGVGWRRSRQPRSKW